MTRKVQHSQGKWNKEMKNDRKRKEEWVSEREREREREKERERMKRCLKYFFPWWRAISLVPYLDGEEKNGY